MVKDGFVIVEPMDHKLMYVHVYGMFITTRMNHLEHIQNNLQDQYIKTDKKQVGGCI